METIFLASYPRSGNTFLRYLLETNGLETDSCYNSESRLRLAAMKGASWLFLKTHEQDHALQDNRAIVIIREPEAAIMSYAHYKKNYEGDPRDILVIAKNLILNGDYWTHLKLWTNRPRSVVIKFEQLIKEPLILDSLLMDMGISFVKRSIIRDFADFNKQDGLFFHGSREMPLQLRALLRNQEALLTNC